MTRAEFDIEVNRQCAYCARGAAIRYRPETREHVHDSRTGAGFSITICRANQFRNEHEEFSGG